MKIYHIHLFACFVTLCVLVTFDVSCSKNDSGKADTKTPKPITDETQLSIPTASSTPSDKSTMGGVKLTEEQRRMKERWEEVAHKNKQLRELNEENRLVGMSQQELEALVGRPTNIDGSNIIYFLDTGLGGRKWTLEIHNHVVTRVTMTSLQ